MKANFALCLMLAAIIPTVSFSQSKSPKRGICWDEKSQPLSDAPVNKMLPGVSWIYTWGEAPMGEAAHLGPDKGMDFVPMAWGRNFDEAALRSYLDTHKGVKYLLGFNEPNFAAQAAMTPTEAADRWPALERIATEYGLKLVAPALNFTGESVGGKVWGIYDWLDEFIGYYKVKRRHLPKIDCLALHCYMNWYGASTWFVNDYLYSDIFKNGNDTKYPNLVELLNSVKSATGQYPRMMLTEFCSWEGDKDGFVTNVDNQIDQMTQRIQKMEQSDLVESYAWFMANSNASEFPYMSVFETNHRDSELSPLGKVYVNMSAFDRNKYFKPGELIAAKDYIDATTDDRIVRVRPNSEVGSALPLLVSLSAAAPYSSAYSAATYQIEVPKSGTYTLTLHAMATGGKVAIEIAGAQGDTEMELAGHPGEWADHTVSLTLPAGKNTLKISNLSDSPVSINSWRFESDSSIADITASSDGQYTVYNLFGTRLATCPSLSSLNLAAGIYLIVSPDGTSRKTII